MKYVKLQLRKDFIMPLKSNRKVAVSETDKQKGRYVAVETLDLPAGSTREGWLEEVPFAVLLIKQVFKNDDGSTGVRYLVTSDLTLSDDRITKLFQKCWGIEVYHKSLKQNAALEKSPTRTETTQRHHLFASLCAYVKMERFEDQNQTKPLCAEIQTLLSRSQGLVRRICQIQRAIRCCVTSVTKKG